MARPAVEWPIPAYIVELRERLVMTFRLGAGEVARLSPTPVAAHTLQGEGLVSLCLSNGRCLKSVGGIPVLASEFRLAELLTPVRWQPACRSVVQGVCALRFYSTSHGLVRLMRTALDLAGEVRDKSQLLGGRIRAMVEPCWPEDSIFDSAEHAEGMLLHPEWYFAPDRRDRLVRAVPVHQYARSTVHVEPEQVPDALVAQMLRISSASLKFDHAVLQKRCTHTFSFPPETIIRTRPAVTNCFAAVSHNCVALAV